MSGFLINPSATIPYSGEPQGTVAMNISVGMSSRRLIPVVFQCSFEGTQNQTTSEDESFSAHAMTFNSGAKIDTAQKKFGTSSLKVNGTDDYVSMPTSDDWHFGTGDFTIEGFWRWEATPSSNLLIEQNFSSKSWRLLYVSSITTLRFYGSANGSSESILLAGSFAPVVNTWYHLAVSFDGTTYRMWVDGTHVASSTSTINFFNSTAALTISNTNLEFDGWVDEVRIQKGKAEYTGSGSITVPTAEFPAAY